MLETKGLIKVYKPKKGIPVKALDNVSIRFPEKGMVFLLGKSGSGKSTLLNVLGGLDRYDGGEIVIKGTSSKKFRQKHFDSYRNTYIGFIFQEYNILDEFSVGANIALALQLQGRKATNDEINKILEEVDLAGYGNRKPNELSGGQKQRVAIARALVKNPQIIMADEPTGALDSVTGKQVLDTLKKLSAEKLVIIVSHDREFAEKYADRIIELADGKVISDVEYDSEGVAGETAESLVFEGNTVTIPEKYRLTEEDRKQINAYIEKLEKGEVTLTVGTKKEEKAAGRVSRPTDESRITLKSGDFKLIKSRLPLRFAFKMGASSLKFKKVRLVFTIILSCIAFGLFGLADTIGAYDYVTTGTQSLIDSNVNYASYVKLAKYYYGSGTDDFFYIEDGHYISREDIESIFEKTGVRLSGVYAPANSQDGRIFLDDWLGPEDIDMDYSAYGQSIYNSYVRGFVETELTPEMKLLAGKMPAANSDEIAITAYTLEVFKQRGFIPSVLEGEEKKTYYIVTDWDVDKQEEIVTGLTDDYGNFYPIDEFDMSIFDEGYRFDGYSYYPEYDYKETEAEKITAAEDMIGKEILGYKIVGVVDTGLEISRYEHIYEYELGESTAESILKYALQSEFENLVNYSTANVIFVGEGFVDKELKKTEGFCIVNYGGEITDVNSGGYIDSLNIIAIADKVAPEKAFCINGKTPDTLSDDEIILPLRLVKDNFSHDMYYEWDEDGNLVEYSGGPVLISASEFESAGITPLSQEADVYAAIKLTERKVMVSSYYDKMGAGGNGEYTVVGFVTEDEGVSFYANETVAKKFATERDGEFVYAVGQMPTDRDTIRELVKLSDEEGDVCFEMKNPVLYELGILRDAFDAIAPIFMWIGVGFAVFASLMMSNFISTSITHKKREIGILRAIGSRSNDVFRIFFSESFIIAAINFVLTTVGVFALTTIINSVIRSQTGLLVTVLTFGIRQVILLLAVSVLVAVVASFLPVKRIASKKPIDAIRDR